MSHSIRTVGRGGHAGWGKPPPLFFTVTPGPTRRVPLPMLQLLPKPIGEPERRGLLGLLRRVLRG